MFNLFSWEEKNNTLYLYGYLNRDTLLPLWKKINLLKTIHTIHVTDLKQIDSAGLALIIHIYYQQIHYGNNISLSGINNNLKSLINLYHLQDILIFKL